MIKNRQKLTGKSKNLASFFVAKGYNTLYPCCSIRISGI